MAESLYVMKILSIILIYGFCNKVSVSKFVQKGDIYFSSAKNCPFGILVGQCIPALVTSHKNSVLQPALCASIAIFCILTKINVCIHPRMGA